MMLKTPTDAGQKTLAPTESPGWLPDHISGTSSTLPNRDAVVLAAGYLIWGGWACFALHAQFFRPDPDPWVALWAAFLPALIGFLGFAFDGNVLALALGLLLNLVLLYLYVVALNDLLQRGRRTRIAAVLLTILPLVAPLLR